MRVPYEVAEECHDETLDIMEVLAKSASVLWESWPMEMRCNRPYGLPSNVNTFSLSGACPHCTLPSVFVLWGEPLERGIGGGQSFIYGILRCSGCGDCILGIVKKQSAPWVYFKHYPLDRPNDRVAEEVPEDVASDFREALRCRWVNAYNATVEMCRRALEASCLEQGAPEDLVLAKMIDWVHGEGKITTPLKEMAHKIKLGGNRGAHPSDRTIIADDADAVIEFTKEYFHHVYVMPKRMAKFNFEKPKAPR